MSTSFPISKLLEPVELGDRWKRARIGALRKVVGPLPQDGEEQGLLDLDEDKRSQLLRAVFENSKKLGDSARWYYGAEWEPSDFLEIVPQLGSPCFDGEWSSMGEGVALERPGCGLVKSCGSFACEYFKEAMDGLALGLSGAVTYFRHTSRGTGAESCKDIFVTAEDKKHAFGPLPQHLNELLQQTANKLLESDGIKLEVRGQQESVICYQWQLARGGSCGDLSGLVAGAIQDALSAAGFDEQIKDITPRAVLSPGDSSTDSDEPVRPAEKLVQISKISLVQISKGGRS